MRTLPRLVLTSCALALASGCAFEPFDLGDSTRGDEGRSDWSLSDGMCPGLGSCALDVPIATGASVRVVVELPDRLVAELTPVVVVGDATLDAITRDAELEHVAFEVTPASAGTVVIAIVDPDGETIDRSRFEARDPMGLTCGQIPPGTAVGYPMTALVEGARELTLLRASSDEAPMLACRVTDADGEALLSADLVRWTVDGDPPLVRVQSELLDFLADGTADGARVWVSPSSTEETGATEITASFGEHVERFAVTVE